MRALHLDFYIPQYKDELVKFLTQRYPTLKWNRKSKKQLMAIYIRLRQELLKEVIDDK